MPAANGEKQQLERMWICRFCAMTHAMTQEGQQQSRWRATPTPHPYHQSSMLLIFH